MNLVGVRQEVVQLSLSHQLHHSLQSSCPGQVACFIVLCTADYQLFRPMHVFGGKTIAASCQFNSYVWYLLQK